MTLHALGTPDRPEIRFHVLGGVECIVGDSLIEIRGATQRALLAALLSAESRPVSTGALVEELWGQEPPNTAENSLQAHVSRLRRKLPSRAGRGPTLACVPGGYRLTVPSQHVDALEFLEAVSDARHQCPEIAVEQLHRALALWRGEVFGGPLGGGVCQAAAARWQTARDLAFETLVDLELQTGRHENVLPQLIELVVAEPLNERYCEQLMVALYRTGRQTDALTTYQRMRNKLDVELGVDPSPALQRIEHAILRHDDALRPGYDHTVLRRSA